MAASRIRRRHSRRLAAGLLTAAAVAAPIAAAAPAQAWAWSPQVTLTGTVKVDFHPGITGVYVNGSDGEHGWATISGGQYSSSYYFKFYNVPGGSGINVTWTVYTNNGTFSNHFGVARPATGANAVRDLCDFSPGC